MLDYFERDHEFDCTGQERIYHVQWLGHVRHGYSREYVTDDGRYL